MINFFIYRTKEIKMKSFMQLLLSLMNCRVFFNESKKTHTFKPIILANYESSISHQ